MKFHFESKKVNGLTNTGDMGLEGRRFVLNDRLCIYLFFTIIFVHQQK